MSDQEIAALLDQINGLLDGLRGNVDALTAILTAPADPAAPVPEEVV